MKQLLILLCAGLGSIAANGQKALIYFDGPFSYTLALDSALGGDRVNYEYTVKSITIERITDHKVLQVIAPPENTFDVNLPANQVFIIEDCNFDGYADIRLVQFIPANQNVPYYYWTFDKTSNQFRRDTILEEITSPDIDHERKLIMSAWIDGCCRRGNNTYRYIDGKITLVREDELVLDPDRPGKSTLFVRKRINGKMTQVSKTTESD